MHHCAAQLMSLPDNDARLRIVEWLQARVVPQKSALVPVVDDPRQQPLDFQQLKDEAAQITAANTRGLEDNNNHFAGVPVPK